ncbi:MAG TPA: DNA-binding transcriptional regulator [Lachnospiraceae bacterium]|nr:DNA-binding transcriptional regulator [Lachnospiraceae bacterium]
MTGQERRQEIVRRIRCAEEPVAARHLAAQFGVSRQVIVQDMALIRALGYEIISTNRGYILNTPKRVDRVYKVRHTDEQLEEELCAIVDMGGRVENVMIHHRVYGQMEAELHIDSRRRVAEFLRDIRSGKSSPLKNITSDYHYHRVTADSEEVLDLIGCELENRGFLIR